MIVAPKMILAGMNPYIRADNKYIPMKNDANIE
jgi:hypothetical protein